MSDETGIPEGQCGESFVHNGVTYYVGWMRSKMPGENSYGMWLNEQSNGGFEWKFLDFRPKDIENYSPIYIAVSLPDAKSEIASLKSRLERLESEHSEPKEPIFEPSSTIYKYDERTWAAQFYLGNNKIGIRFEADDRRDADRKLGFAMKWALFGHDVAEASLKSRLERLESERAMMVEGLREIKDAAGSCLLSHSDCCCLKEAGIESIACDILAKIKEQK